MSLSAFETKNELYEAKQRIESEKSSTLPLEEILP
jgi:hypothetical protein